MLFLAASLMTAWSILSGETANNNSSNLLLFIISLYSTSLESIFCNRQGEKEIILELYYQYSHERNVTQNVWQLSWFVFFLEIHASISLWMIDSVLHLFQDTNNKAITQWRNSQPGPCPFIQTSAHSWQFYFGLFQPCYSDLRMQAA